MEREQSGGANGRGQAVYLYNITEAVITPVTAKLTLIITESDFTVTEAVMIKYIYLIHYSSYCNALQQL